MKARMRHKKCLPCVVGTPPLDTQTIETFLKELEPGWHLDQHRLVREYTFKNFKEALLFTNDIGELAEEEGHHPDIELGWGRVKVIIFTHKIQGLTESDFILADKIDASHTARFI